MQKYKYIIIGGGMTGSAALKALKESDPQGRIAMFSDEPYEPYDRPPLSKGLWAGKDPEKIFHKLPEHGFDLFLSTKITEIDPDQQTIIDDKGHEYNYQKLLLATGGQPIQLPDVPKGVIAYRTLEDYKTLQTQLKPESEVCVIGGGFIGSEMSAALNQNGHHVTMIFPETGISSLRFPDDLALFLNDYYHEKGVKVLYDCLVQTITKSDDKFKVIYKNVKDDSVAEGKFDKVIIGVGLKPNVALAKAANLDIDDGIVVDEYLQTSDPNIFAAGDVAFFKNMSLDKKTRVEHENHANQSGKLVARNMAGQKEKYDHFPFFYSDLFDLGYEAIGELDKDLEILSDWVEPYRKGTIYYLSEGKIRGIIFWNLWGKVHEGGKLIQEGKTFGESELVGRFSD